MSAQWTGVYCGFPFLHFPNGVPTALSPSLPHWYIVRVHRIDVLHLEKELHLELIQSLLRITQNLESELDIL